MRFPIELQRAFESKTITYAHANRLLDATAEIREAAVSLASKGELSGKTLKKSSVAG